MEKKKPLPKPAGMIRSKAEKSTSWGGVSDWYDTLVESDDSYQSKVIAPNLRRLLGDVKNSPVLDLACGQGYFSRMIASEGAHVVAADISEELIAHAKKKGDSSIQYHVSPAHKLPFIKDHSIDTAICVLAFQNIDNLPEVMAEISRILKKDGRMCVVLNHPAFRIPQGSDWGYDAGKNIQFRKEEYYLSEKKIAINMHPGKSDSEQTVSFHRPLQYYFKLFGKYGFAVTRLEEWNSHKKSQKGPREAAEDRARKEFPLFMCLEMRRM